MSTSPVELPQQRKRLPHFLNPGQLISLTTAGLVINTYTRCSLRCVYCCTRAQGRSTPVCSPDDVVENLRAELDEITVRPKPTIGIGCIVDAYVPEDEELGLTRLVIGELLEQEFPMAVVTKSPLIWRDHDLLTWQGVAVQVSISSLDDDELLEFEPHVPPASERFNVVDKLAAVGVDVAVAVIPWIPRLTNVEAIIDRVPDDVTILVGPMEVQADVIGPGAISKRFDQAAVNDAYLAEHSRIGRVDNVAWRKPVSASGSDEGRSQATAYVDAGVTAYRWLCKNRNVPRSWVGRRDRG